MQVSAYFMLAQMISGNRKQLRLWKEKSGAILNSSEIFLALLIKQMLCFIRSNAVYGIHE